MVWFSHGDSYHWLDWNRWLSAKLGCLKRTNRGESTVLYWPIEINEDGRMLVSSAMLVTQPGIFTDFKNFKCCLNYMSKLDRNYPNPRLFSLADAAWKHPQFPGFCLLPLEFGVNIDIHKHENSEVIHSNRNKSPKEMSRNQMPPVGKHVNRFHLTKCTG